MIEKPFGKILLASGSPRRFQLLSEAGFDVEIVKGKNIEETFPSNLQVHKVPAYLSEIKASPFLETALLRKLPLLAADTVVILDGEIIGKPNDKEDAIKMIGKLSGNMHEVVSGVTLVKTDGSRKVFSDTTKVFLNEIPERMIRWYVEKYEPLDKAGAYGVQEWIGLVGVKRIEGDFYNVMGLPIGRVVRELERF